MSQTPAEFIARWKDSAGAELANSQSFLNELCDLLGVQRPDPSQADEEKNEYVFEKTVLFKDLGADSHGRIDLYRKDCFVLESKQGVERQEERESEILSAKKANARRKVGTALRGTPPWNFAMQKAAAQARRYAAAVEHAWPPFLIVVDVGYCIDLYADFSRSGKSYQPFPDTLSFRIYLAELASETTRDLLRTIWTDPLSLDPTKRSAAVTREVAGRLAKLAKQLERNFAPDRVAQFLMRCLFTMFAEDIRIGNFPENGFTDFLKSRRDKLDRFVPSLENLWQAMDRGTYSDAVEAKLARFNGGLFADCEALPLTEDQLELLIEAADSKWEHVEPAIFGTLLERALDPVERHKLGAHYTPRAYVERLVLPTVIEPLREEWQATYAAAVAKYQDGDKAKAIELVSDWHQTLCDVSVLDPACGTGNFLYVALELIKRLEGEVLLALKEFGGAPPLHHVRPPQFHGIEVNPRAAAIADLVLEIGYLQWQVRSVGREHVNEPILDKERNIECRDALLVWDAEEDVTGPDGAPVTRWDGRTTRPSPVTGEEIPDETARVTERRYLNPRKAEWPKADYIVGNPPFIGASRMRYALGDGYTTTVRSVYKELPESCDFVMYWWHNAAEIVRAGDAKRFGFITTNSIRQTFNRRVIEPHLTAKNPLSIVFAIPDHPWVDSTDGAAVRIAITTGKAGSIAGKLFHSRAARPDADQAIELSTVGLISSALGVGPATMSAQVLRASESLAAEGVKPHGMGFVLTQEVASDLGYGRESGVAGVIAPYFNGRDIAARSRNALIIDLHGLEIETVRTRFPALFQHVLTYVKPERDTNNEKYRRENWWLFGRKNTELRAAITGLDRFVVTVKTSKYRYFVFIAGNSRPDSKLIAFALVHRHRWELGLVVRVRQGETGWCKEVRHAEEVRRPADRRGTRRIAVG
ncbi:MAG TPA: DNA methyltransferase, partial [Pirellulaceae bacterium]|nr:DNA methyltransferase [Pirellulaceae bacterium]